LIDLALYSQNGQVALHQIAARQNLSIKYLEQDFATLRKAGLVRSIKGAQGGYILARPADQIRVGDIVRILEGDLSLVDIQDVSGSADPDPPISDRNDLAAAQRTDRKSSQCSEFGRSGRPTPARDRPGTYVLHLAAVVLHLAAVVPGSYSKLSRRGMIWDATPLRS